MYWAACLLASLGLLWSVTVSRASGFSSEVLLDRAPPDRRAEIQEILGDPTFVRSLRLEVEANPQVFAHLLDHPDLAASLGSALGIAHYRLVQIGPGRYQGDDGGSNSGSLEVLWTNKQERALLEQGVSRGWWFGDIHGRVVVVTDFTVVKRHIEGEVEVWARIDRGLADQALRLLTPVLGGFLDRKLREEFAVTFQVAEKEAREPEKFCRVLTELTGGSRAERQKLADLSGCSAQPSGSTVYRRID